MTRPKPIPLVDDLAAVVRMMRDDIRNIVRNWEHGDLAEAVNWAEGSVPAATRVLRRCARTQRRG